MKIKTALKRSIAGAKFAAVLFLIALWLVFTYPNRATYFFLAVSAFYLIGDVVNIIWIKRKTGKDPGYLDEKIK